MSESRPTSRRGSGARRGTSLAAAATMALGVLAGTASVLPAAAAPAAAPASTRAQVQAPPARLEWPA